MRKQRKSMRHQISTKKDRRKLFRGTLQGIFLIFILYIAINAVFSFNKYEPYDEVSDEDNGFIAVSYFGAALQTEGQLIGQKDLDEHLTALKKQGYVTITQQDVIDYYKEGKPLPKRALYLAFEDSRSDTAIYANRLLEKHNLVATMFSYGQGFEKRDSRFIKGKDMIGLRDSGFWEIGTNGYRFEYINVFQYGDQFVGRVNNEQYLEKVTDVDAIYNHYLKDYIRDERSIPVETYDGMKERIDYDYRRMKELYEAETGEVPAVYAMEYANSGESTSNANVRALNEQWIYSLFDMNFNRSGYSVNNRNNSIYDLTRIQPKAHWSTNHLLMRIADDINEELEYVDGNLEQKSQWEISSGAAEFKDKQIILTSTPNGDALMNLKGSQEVKDLNISVRLKGNKTGSQTIYLRANENLTQGVKVEVIEDKLIVYDMTDLGDKEVISIDLEDIEGEYYELNEYRDRLFEITLKEDKLSIKLDKEEIISDQTMENNQPGLVYVQSKSIDGINIRRGLADEIYDARFEDFVITEYTESDKEEILFNNKLKGVTRLLYDINKACHDIIDWFVENL